MKQILIVLIASLTVTSAWATAYSGKCAKEAETATVKKWADVPNPDPELEYVTISSKAIEQRSDTYVVELSFFDGNEESGATYKVVFEDLSDCSRARVTQTN
jgi:hypothetical protein